LRQAGDRLNCHFLTLRRALKHLQPETLDQFLASLDAAHAVAARYPPDKGRLRVGPPDRSRSQRAQGGRGPFPVEWGSYASRWRAMRLR
jgi:hypothetical protein